MGWAIDAAIPPIIIWQVMFMPELRIVSFRAGEENASLLPTVTGSVFVTANGGLAVEETR